MEIANRLLKSILPKLLISDNGHVVIDPTDDDKYAECIEQYKELDCHEWLECPICKQWYHNEQCFL